MKEYRLYKGNVLKGWATHKKGRKGGSWVWAREYGGNEGFRSLRGILERVDWLCGGMEGETRAVLIVDDGK
jgi:hypothetical protein